MGRARVGKRDAYLQAKGDRTAVRRPLKEGKRGQKKRLTRGGGLEKSPSMGGGESGLTAKPDRRKLNKKQRKEATDRERRETIREKKKRNSGPIQPQTQTPNTPNPTPPPKTPPPHQNTPHKKNPPPKHPHKRTLKGNRNGDSPPRESHAGENDCAQLKKEKRQRKRTGYGGKDKKPKTQFYRGVDAAKAIKRKEV